MVIAHINNIDNEDDDLRLELWLYLAYKGECCVKPDQYLNQNDKNKVHENYTKLKP